MPQRNPYDLALVNNDLPPWEGLPRRSIVVCSHPRSGSTLLGEAIRFAGGLGCPLEYLHRGFRPTIAARWQAYDLNVYTAAMHRHRTEPNGVFSLKLFWQDVEDIAQERAPDRHWPNEVDDEPTRSDNYRAILDVLSDIIPNPEFVYLKRADRVRQAVSSVVAVQTGVWRNIPDTGQQEARAPAEYDYDRILSQIAYADYCHDNWQAFFAANGIVPRALSYETLVGDYEKIVGSLLETLGANDPVPQPRRMRRQADDTNETMVRRFLTDHAARTASRQL